MPDSWIVVSIALAGIVSATLVACYRVRALLIDRRIAGMMLACGIDESVAADPDRHPEINLDVLRRRCRACPDPVTCQRYLSGDAVPDNGFCPNASQFRALAEPEACRVHYDPRHRPGRRLDA